MSNVEVLRYKLEEYHNRCSLNKHLLVWGLGNTYQLYKNIFEYEGIKVEFYVDSNEKLQHTIIDGIQVIPPKEIPKNSMVLVCVMDRNIRRDIEKQLGELKIKYIHIDAYIWSNHIHEILSVIDVLDDESKDVYVDVILSRMANAAIKNFSGKQYFCLPEFAGVKLGEIFVDCGAFVGDTVETYIWERECSFGKIYAIEPFLPNYNAMKKRFKRLCNEWGIKKEQLSPILGAVGSKSMKMSVKTDTCGLGAIVRNDKNGYPINIYTIDELFVDQHVDFIKADIESFEYDMLLGAKETLIRDKPKMAICLYHNASDFYRVPLFIKSLGLGYKFSIGHHQPSYTETILYAF